MSIKSVYSQAQSPAQAVAELKEKLGNLESKFMIVFASRQYDQDALNSELQTSFKDATIIGCSTAGEIVSGHMFENSVVAMSMDANVIDDLKVEVIENLKEDGDISKAFKSFEDYYGSPMSELDYSKHVGIVLIDGMTMAEEKLMESLGDRTNVTFIGASAGDDLQFKQTFVYANGKAYSNAAVLALLKPTVGFDFIKTQSFCEGAKKLIPTKVDHETRTVLEFNGKPAVEAYAEAVGVSADQVADKFMAHPVGLMAGDDPFVRSPQQPNDKGLAFYCNVLEGIELSVLEPMDIVADTRKAVEAKQAELGKITGIVDFHCILRTLQLRNEGRTEEYGQIFNDIPTVGFSTYGEEFITHVNQTSTMLVFK